MDVVVVVVVSRTAKADFSVGTVEEEEDELKDSTQVIFLDIIPSTYIIGR